MTYLWHGSTGSPSGLITYKRFLQLENNMTYLWQEERGKQFYKVQTDERDVAKKMRRRNGFRLCGQALNADPASGTGIWIFSCRFSRPDKAKQALKSITGKMPKIDSEGVILYE